MLLAAALALIAVQQPAPAEPAADDIVVTAAKTGCRVQLAEKILSDAEFRERAKRWAEGAPVRVVARATTSFACMKEIAFKLTDWGVKRIQFVDPSGKDIGLDFPQPKGVLLDRTTMPTGPIAVQPFEGALATSDIEHRLHSARAAQLILAGKCAEARRLMLEKGDLEAAAQVAQICRGN